MSHHDPSNSVSTTRRRFLAASGTALLTAATGCSALVNAIGSQVFEEVNVLNEMDRTVSGSVEVTDPDGDTALEATFDLSPMDSDEESNVVAYDDVWEAAGDYDVSIELTDVDIEGTSQASKTVTIDDTTENMVAIAVGSDETDEPVAIRVGDSFSDFAPTES